MARRRMTIKRLDPWSVLKFGAVVNLAVLAIGLLVVAVVFFFIDRLGLIDQACDIARDVGFTACGLNMGNLFRAVALLGLLATIVQTAVWVFLSFLHNLIADLTGGLTISVIDDGPVGQPRAATSGSTTTGGTPVGSTGSGRPPVPPLGSERAAQARGAGPGPGQGTAQGTGRGPATGPGQGSGRVQATERPRSRTDETAAYGPDDGDLFGGR